MSKQQIVDELHKPARKNFKRRRVIMIGRDNLWQADLADMSNHASENNGYKYILLVIDTFSKFGWGVPLKHKTGLEVTKAMKSILNQGRIPENIQTDDGTEFYNKDFKRLMNGINHYSTYSVIKAGQAERFVRTIKEKLFKRFSLQGSYKWYNILENVLKEYNSTKHRTIGMAPIKVDNKLVEQHLLRTVYNHIKVTEVPKFKVNDVVRISRHKKMFEKGYTIKWTPELFRIRFIRLTSPITYLLEDLHGVPIKGGFYHYEIQKTQNSESYLIEKILKRKNGQLFVKWLGFGPEYNEWISEEDLLE